MMAGCEQISSRERKGADDVTKEQEDALRTALFATVINPSWPGYSTLGDMLDYFCDGESRPNTWGSDVVMDRLIIIIRQAAAKSA
jgi:hypothetical protein